MSNVNKCEFTGNLAADPETRVTPNGNKVVEFRFGNNRGWNDKKTGDKKEESHFFDVEAWGDLGERFAKFHKKGDPIHIYTRSKVDSWEDKNTGERRSRVKFVLDEFFFAAGKSRSNDNGNGNGNGNGHADGAEPTRELAPFRKYPPASSPQRSRTSSSPPPVEEPEDGVLPDADIPF